MTAHSAEFSATVTRTEVSGNYGDSQASQAPRKSSRGGGLALVHSAQSPEFIDQDSATQPAAKKHAGGRPSKYSDALIAKGHAYVDGGFEEGEAVPTVGGLASYLGVRTQTLYNWRKSPDKAEAVEWLLECTLCEQELMLVNGGLTGKFNPAICKLMLAKHGYTTKRVSNDGI